jgi:UDP-4-amino-4,6-dideoxy-N-acetyl-beta-L-altrosamine transaminase
MTDSPKPARFLPYGRQYIDEDDINAVAEALRSDYLTTGPKVAEFEEHLCALTGASHAIATSNGTTALHLACIAANLGPGDVAIVPTLTFLATANAVRYCGADVVFADVDPQTGLLTEETLIKAICEANGRAKAVLPVHLAGQCVDMEAIKSIAEKHKLIIIADSCHALGSEYRANAAWHGAGSCALEDMAAFSFHPVKTIAMGEGGAITTNNPEWAKRMKRLRHHGMLPHPDVGPWSYDMPELGYNYREPDILCALGVSQLKKIDFFLQKRKTLVARYNQKIVALSPIVQGPHIISPDAKTGWHLYAARIDFDKAGQTRADLMNKLKERGIGTQVHYIPVHSQPYYQSLYGIKGLPGAKHYYNSTLSFPLFPSMEEDDVDYVIETLSDILK